MAEQVINDYDHKGLVLVVDDNPFVLESAVALLKADGYDAIGSSDPENALARVKQGNYEAVVTDIKMPKLTGIELLEEIKRVDPSLPVIIMTAYADIDTAVEAVRKSAFDFIIKPYRAESLSTAVSKAVGQRRLLQIDKEYRHVLEDVVVSRTKELNAALERIKETSREIAYKLTTVSEFRDTDTGEHIKRIGLYSGALASACGLDNDFVENITVAGAMHDIGKVGIPDSILLKPGRLTDEEIEIMKTHTTKGYKILDGSPYEIVQMAASIAHTHHERWDGTGYPRGLKGGDIPVEGRITILGDQYDALRSRRPYKEPLTHEAVIRIIVDGDGRTLPEHFDPELLKTFLRIAPRFDDIFNRHSK